MPNTTPDPDDQADDAAGEAASEEEAAREKRAEELYEEAEAEESDPVTRREALEGELEDEGLSDEGEELGEHIE
jgi:hypothetical protein